MPGKLAHCTAQCTTILHQRCNRATQLHPPHLQEQTRLQEADRGGEAQLHHGMQQLGARFPAIMATRSELHV